MYSTAFNLWTFTWFVHFELLFRLKGTEKIHTERFSEFPFNIYSILYVWNTFNTLQQGPFFANAANYSFFLFCWIFRKSNKHETRKLCNVHCTLYTFDSICWFEINHLLFYIIISNTLQTHIFLSLHFWKFKLWHFDLEELTFCNIKVVKPKH